MPAYKRAAGFAEDSDATRTIDDLEAAERHAATVSRDGRIHREVRERLADMRHLQGRIAFNAKRYEAAYRSWAEALRMSPRHRHALHGMDELRKIGEEIYLEGYMFRELDREAAIRKFEDEWGAAPRRPCAGRPAKSLSYSSQALLPGRPSTLLDRLHAEEGRKTPLSSGSQTS